MAEDGAPNTHQTGTKQWTVIVLAAIVAAAAVAITAIIVLGGHHQVTTGTPTTKPPVNSQTCGSASLFDLVASSSASFQPTPVPPGGGSMTAYCANGWAVLQNFTIQAGSDYGLAVFKEAHDGWKFVILGDTSGGGAGYDPCTQYPAAALDALGGHLCTAPSSTTTTSPPAIPTSTTAPPVPVTPNCASGSPQVARPTSIYVGCATGDDSLTNITWTLWTTSSATGTATYNVNQCEPDCADGVTTSSSVSVVLSNPATISGVLTFQNLSINPGSGTGTSASIADGSGSWGSA